MGRDDPSHSVPDRGGGPVAIGDVIDGKYRVDRMLGQGGMGVVVAATHVELGSSVAIKLVRAEVARHPQILARFQREARIAARLKSDHVVRVMDVGTFPPGSGGAPFMVLEMLEGADVAVMLAKRGPLPIDEAVRLVLEACEAVEEAHALGIVHRDLKPANLFLARRPKGRPIVKVLDFGISSVAAGSDDARLTATGSVMGTPLYMAPEQMLDARNADKRSDIWALGAILYELLTGAPPFPGGTFGQVHARVLSTEATPIRERRPEVPAELDALVLRCLKKAADQRFASVGDLDAALRPFVEVRPALVSSPTVESAPAMSQHTTHVLGAGAAARQHTTQVLAGGSVPVVTGTPVVTAAPVSTTLPAPAAATASDARTVLVQPRPHRSGRGALVGGVVLAGAAAVGVVVMAMRADGERGVAAPAGSVAAVASASTITGVATAAVVEPTASTEPAAPPSGGAVPSSSASVSAAVSASAAASTEARAPKTPVPTARRPAGPPGRKAKVSPD